MHQTKSDIINYVTANVKSILGDIIVTSIYKNSMVGMLKTKIYTKKKKLLCSDDKPAYRML